MLSELEQAKEECRAAFSKAKTLREQKQQLSRGNTLDEGSTGCTLNPTSPTEHRRRKYVAGTPTPQVDNMMSKHGVQGDTGSTLGTGRTPLRSPNRPDADKIDNRGTEDVFGNSATSPTVQVIDQAAELEAACDAEEEHAMYLHDLAEFLRRQACLMHERRSRDVAVRRDFVV